MSDMAACAAFIRDRVSEWEQAALEAAQVIGNGHWLSGQRMVKSETLTTVAETPADAHIALNDPARVLAQVAAMRRMLDLRYSWALQIEKAPEQVRHVFEAEVNAADAIIQGFAAIWASHDQYDPAWAPDA